MMPEPVEDEAAEELASIQAIFPELIHHQSYPRFATLDLEVIPEKPIKITFKPTFTLDSVKSLHINEVNGTGAENRPEDASGQQYATHELSHLPPLHMGIELPQQYPESSSPIVRLTSSPAWLPKPKLKELEAYADTLWEGYGHGQIVFGYIDFLQSQIENGFELDGTDLTLSQTLEAPLLNYERHAKKAKFDSQTFDCGICLYPKKGSACCQIRGCNHVFCIECLQDFYNSAISEGSVETVTCLEPTCGKKGEKRRPRSLHPTELLAIPISREQVQRYVDLKLKKMLESDKTTIYCPRRWCQAPARSAKYQKFDTTDLENWPNDPDSDDEEADDANNNEHNHNTNLSTKKNSNSPDDRLAICSRCTYAFCHVCAKSWHGEFVSCLPRTAENMTEEEKASIDFIRLYTSPCAYCGAPAQKTMGCNHMRCPQCRGHFCYLCSAWLDPDNPYAHFNTKGTPCYMRLWELEEGDEAGANGNRGVFAGVRGAEQQAEEFAQEILAEDGAPGENGNANGINQDGLQHFLAMAAADEEDGWDSDELDARPVMRRR